VDQNVNATLHISTGFVTNAEGPIQTFDRKIVMACLQELTSVDLEQLEALNVQVAQKAVLLNGAAISRINKLGGDLIMFPNGHAPEGNRWRTLACLEQGGGAWCKVAVMPDVPLENSSQKFNPAGTRPPYF
jgi:hypothetical protein